MSTTTEETAPEEEEVELTAVQLRVILGWGFVRFFLRLTNRRWSELPYVDRAECLRVVQFYSAA